MVAEITKVPDPTPLVLFGIPFHDVTFDEAVAWSVARMKAGRPSYIATANVDFIMQAWADPELQRILLEADLVIADGAPIVWASGKFGPKLRERVTGSDITPMLAAACAKESLRIFLLGGGTGVAEKAAAVLCDRNPGLTICGTYSPPLASVLEMDHAEILQKLHDAKPDLLLVAFGAPKQEKFINMNLRNWDVPLAIGIGGTLDFLAGAQKRAPVIVQKIGMEWLWRMLTNPKRLFQRYARNLAFMRSSYSRLTALRKEEARHSQQRDADPVWPNVNFEALGAQTLGIEELGSADRRVGEGRHLLINLRRCVRLDSLVLGRLLTTARGLRKFNRRLLLVFPAPNLDRFLRECRLDGYFEIFADGAQAVEWLQKWQREARAGEVMKSGETLKLRLPIELTAAAVGLWAVRVEAALTGTIRQVEADASGLEFLDSSGLGWLLSLRKNCDQRGAKLVCRDFQGRPLQTLKLAKLDSVFVQP